MHASSYLKPILAICAAIAVWSGDSQAARAQFGGLQIQIGRGGYYGGGYNLAVPFGVGPSIPPTSRAYMGPDYGLRYNSGYSSGYRGYYGYSALPTPGNFGVTPFDYPSPTYRNYGYNGSGPYSGDGISNYQQQLDLYQLQLRAEQARLYSQQSQLYRSQQPYSSSSPRSNRAGQQLDDLRPGMVLPDGSTVISVDPPGAPGSAQQNPQPAPANPLPADPTGAATDRTRRSNRASF